MRQSLCDLVDRYGKIQREKYGGNRSHPRKDFVRQVDERPLFHMRWTAMQEVQLSSSTLVAVGPYQEDTACTQSFACNQTQYSRMGNKLLFLQWDPEKSVDHKHATGSRLVSIYFSKTLIRRWKLERTSPTNRHWQSITALIFARLCRDSGARCTCLIRLSSASTAW